MTGAEPLDKVPMLMGTSRSEPRVFAAGSGGAMLLVLVDRLFLRALQFVLGGVLLGIVFLPVRSRDSALDVITAAGLVALAVLALRHRAWLLSLLRRRPQLTLLFPVPALVAVALDGGFDSVWTPLVAITVGVPATLGLPWLSLGCALVAATGQALAAWINRVGSDTDQLFETAVFNAIGTVSVGVGIALSVATLAGFLRRRTQIIQQLRHDDLLLAAARSSGEATRPRELVRAPRETLSPAELRVVTRLAAGRAPKQIAAELGVAVPTVRSHLKAAKRKTHARTLTELVGLFVLEDGQL
jgi:DNA-binding CsgD family transcriptional regulator